MRRGTNEPGDRSSKRILSDDDDDISDDDLNEKAPLMSTADGEKRVSRTEGGAGLTFTMDQALKSVGVGSFQKFVLLPMCGVAVFAEGSYAVHLALLTVVVRAEWGVTPIEASGLIFLLFGGSMLGGVVWGPLSDRWGRRVAYLLSTSLCFVAGVAGAFASSYGMLLGTVFLVGVGMAGVVVSVSLFGEFLTNRTRTPLLMALMAFWSLGSLIQAFVAMLVVPVSGWRFWVGLSATPFAVAVTMFPFLPESPHWLVATGRYDAAVGVLGKLARYNEAGTLPPGRLAYSEEPKRGSVTDLCYGKWLATTVLLTFVSFITFLSYFGTNLMMIELFRHDEDHPVETTPKTGLSTQDYEDIMIVTSAEFPGLVLVGLVMELGGRRVALGAGSVVSGALLLCFLIPQVSGQAAERTLLFVIKSLLFGIANVVMIYQFEVFPTNVRATAMSFLYVFSRVGACSSSPVVEELLLIDRRYPAVVFGGLLLLSGLLTCCLPIETRKRDLLGSAKNEPKKAPATKNQKDKNSDGPAGGSPRDDLGDGTARSDPGRGSEGRAGSVGAAGPAGV